MPPAPTQSPTTIINSASGFGGGSVPQVDDSQRAQGKRGRRTYLPGNCERERAEAATVYMRPTFKRSPWSLSCSMNRSRSLTFSAIWTMTRLS
jgi:hypothetical protein